MNGDCISKAHYMYTHDSKAGMAVITCQEISYFLSVKVDSEIHYTLCATFLI